MSLWWKTNLRRSSQIFEPPYVHSTSLFSFNPILHFSSSLSGVYIDPAFFSPNVAGSSATVASPSARHIPKKSVRPRRLISATQLRYRAMMTKTATPCRNEKSGKYPGIYRNFYATKVTLRSLLLPFLLANERRASGSITLGYACHPIARYTVLPAASAES